ncbi:MAG: hypothetical protein ACLRT4_13935 [Thomasclavelia sp.]
MARTKTAIEFIKDKAGKLFIKANSIVTDDNESLQDILDELKLCMYSGSKICNPGGSNSVLVHKWSEIQSSFQSAFGFKPYSKETMGILFTNGDAGANGVHINGATWLGDDLYATLNSTTSNNIRINYAYFYNK